MSAVLHNQHRVELAWTLVPAAILLYIAFAQVGTWAEAKYKSRMPAPGVQHAVNNPRGSVPVQAAISARQFEWRVRYPNPKAYERWANPDDKAAKAESESWGQGAHYDDIHLVNEIHVWAHDKENDPDDKEPQKILIHLRTRDVIHSFFLPNMRIKQDALPGKTIPVWFAAEKGTANTRYNPETKKWDVPTENADLACAELCGWGHYKMRGRLYIHANREDFDNWLRQAFEEQNRHTSAEAQPQ